MRIANWLPSGEDERALSPIYKLIKNEWNWITSHASYNSSGQWSNCVRGGGVGDDEETCTLEKP